MSDHIAPLIENESTQLFTSVQKENENKDPNIDDYFEITNKTVQKTLHDIEVGVEQLADSFANSSFVQDANNMVQNINYKVRTWFGVNSSDSDEIST